MRRHRFQWASVQNRDIAIGMNRMITVRGNLVNYVPFRIIVNSSQCKTLERR